MAGHSKWSKVKRSKGILDAKRGQAFSKFAKEIAVACKHGGGDPGFNPRLRTILMKARAANMPADNIDRAIKKGTGELEGVNYEEITYEGYAPGGVALLVEALTDNKNRTVADMRNIFNKGGGTLGSAGAVKHLFQRKGHLVVAKEAIDEEDLMNLVVEAGAEDMVTQDEVYEITTDPSQFEEVHKAIEGKGIKLEAVELGWFPMAPIAVTDAKTAKSILSLVDALEENEDVQNVHGNYDIPDELMGEE